MARKKSFYNMRPALGKRAFAPLFAVLVLFYLCFHAVSGERGVVALFKESRRLEQLKTELAKVVAEREALDVKVRGLSSNSLDLDLLDERARLMLGMAGKNEMVYFLSTK
jgi:cell division protein FtsB